MTYDVTDSNGNPPPKSPAPSTSSTPPPRHHSRRRRPTNHRSRLPYVELGATALDNYDGDITGSIVIDATAVNTAVVGSYVVTYDVTDANGNPADPSHPHRRRRRHHRPSHHPGGRQPADHRSRLPIRRTRRHRTRQLRRRHHRSIVIDATAVNTAIVGSYSVTYDVTDANGNPAVQVTRTVDVVDTTAPVITLVGANPQTIEVGSPYVELGATALDNYDGDITGSIVIDATAVNTAVVGSYSVTYNVTDSKATPPSKSPAPSTSSTPPPRHHTGGRRPADHRGRLPVRRTRRHRLDNYDGDITGSIVIDATAVNTAIVGSYQSPTTSPTPKATPPSKSPAPSTSSTPPPRSSHWSAPTRRPSKSAPHTSNSAPPHSTTTTATSPAPSSSTPPPSTPRRRLIHSHLQRHRRQGNPAIQVTRTVDVVDTTAPVITLVGANPQTIEVGSPYVELGATALDNYDGDITGSIVIDATAVNTASSAHTPSPTTSPTPTATPPSKSPAPSTSSTPPPQSSPGRRQPTNHRSRLPVRRTRSHRLDNYDGDITGSIVIDATAVNTAVVGSYTVTYNVTDAEGNAAIQVTRTVDVVDTTAPVITLVGANPQTIEVGSPYVELGATALDNYDGDITGSIVIDATAVNTGVVGSYASPTTSPTPKATPPVQVTRTVDVVDTTAPVITLVGANPQTIEVGSPYVELGATASTTTTATSPDRSSSTPPQSTPRRRLIHVTYNVTDAKATPPVQVTRTVDVVDTTAPVITLVGANPQTIEVGSPYVELGATASITTTETSPDQSSSTPPPSTPPSSAHTS